MDDDSLSVISINRKKSILILALSSFKLTN